MRRLLTILAALGALAASSCAPDSEQALSVTVIGEGRMALADPSAGALSTPNSVLIENAAQGLVRFSADGQVVPGLAERWNVSEDGLSYIFRIAPLKWSNGRTANARDVARLLNRQLRPAGRGLLKDSLGAVSEIVAMTDRVIEIRLSAQRPNLLQLLAQPEMGLVREGHGTGPFTIDSKQDVPDAIKLTRRIQVIDDDDRVEHVHLRSAAAAQAIGRFSEGETDLVLGGTFADLPLVPRGDRRMRNALRFDPVVGLFGLRPARSGGPLADKELRQLLNQAIDRQALIAALDVPNLLPRTTLLQDGLDGDTVPVAPPWAAQENVERAAAVARKAQTIIDREEPLRMAIALPDGPGGDILFNRLATDWRPLGIELVRAGGGVRADLELVDRVAPSKSPAWFVRHFRCGEAPICSEDADALIESARVVALPAQRAALLAEAGRLIDLEVLFMPITAPIRWSLVGDGLPGFAENIYARHPLSGLRDRPVRERQ